MNRETHLNLTEASKYVGVSVPLMRELIASGEIRAFRLSPKTIRIAREDLDTWLASCEIKPKTEPAQAA
ncbi:hypothetical protein AA309_12055 [Microvirga vignae]|uniref:Helix-turn-helix domain-containing protein n=1 Tax=Microvirga vignae TaxID=1225564 RepID=A0A0H1RJS1_9HYPH|nr:helix-turn-helix domain-containing protein [Microvirga vignae]KLK92852.1 hypothetical protein AA309_12055 [Microvirga vignae]